MTNQIAVWVFSFVFIGLPLGAIAVVFVKGLFAKNDIDNL